MSYSIHGNRFTATPAQITANRRNAQLSTGPRSELGKAVSRFNALKTGIQAKSHVIPGEDPAELDQLAADYHRQFHPSTPVECFLVDTIVNADWQLRRLHKVEAKLWDHALSEDNSGLGDAYTRNLAAFTRLHHRLEAVERSYYRALKQLQQLQESSEDDLDFDLPPFPAAGLPSELGSFSPSPQPVEMPVPTGAAPREENKALRL